MSPENQGVFWLIKEVTQPVISRQDWTTDGPVVMHQIKYHLYLPCCHWIEK